MVQLPKNASLSATPENKLIPPSFPTQNFLGDPRSEQTPYSCQVLN